MSVRTKQSFRKLEITSFSNLELQLLFSKFFSEDPFEEDNANKIYTF